MIHIARHGDTRAPLAAGTDSEPLSPVWESPLLLLLDTAATSTSSSRMSTMARVTARVTTKALFCSARAALLEDEYLFQRGKRCKARRERKKGRRGASVHIPLKREREEKKSLGEDLRWAKNPHKYKLNLRIPCKGALRYEMLNACSMIVLTNGELRPLSCGKMDCSKYIAVSLATTRCTEE